MTERVTRDAPEPDVDALSDDELLALCNARLEQGAQQELGDLLERHGEGALPPGESARLEELMRLYRRGLVRKARAMKAAVARGLKRLR